MDQLGAGQSAIGILAFSVAIAIVFVLSGLLIGVYAYYRRRLSAAVEDAGDAADLAAFRDQCRAEVAQAQEWMSAQREELLKLEAEREAQERLRLELNEAEIQTASAEQRADEARKEVLELQHAATALSEDRERLAKEIDESTGAAARAQEELRDLEAKRDSALELTREAEARAEHLGAALREQEETLTQLKTALRGAEGDRDRIDSEVRSLEVRQETMQAEIARLTSELIEAQAKLTRAQADVEPIREQVRERLRLEAEVKELHSSISELEQRRSELEEAQGIKISSTRFSDLFEIEPPALADRIFSSGSLSAISEDDALTGVERHLAAQGLIFPKRVLHAFHTCLKVNDISPITVLAGISGTGKSELPLRYAEGMGIHSQLIAVQPSWSSPQDLFGFYNYLEKRYKATELARALVRMDPYNFSDSDPAYASVQQGSRADRMLLVLVDEMNLARVEYYFSEFLSKLEARRAVIDPAVAKQRSPAEVEIDSAQRLWVGNNVLFAGTMNEDESTQTLSDKVLDRANVLRFGKPPTTSARGSAKQRSNEFARNQYLPHATWLTWIRPVQQESRWRRSVDDWIEELNRALALIGRPFGWRVKQAIHEYVANYPGVEGGSVYRTAVADQVEQKILPKLRGVDVTQQQVTEALSIVESVLEDLGDTELLDAVKNCQNDATYGTFNWRGVTRE